MNIVNDKNNFLSGLNNEQRIAVTYNDGPLQIVAGPGSGKTKTLTYKIAYLINFLAIAPYRILAITFTNKATNEMVLRTNDLVNVNQPPNIRTYHSFCAWLLRIEAESAGLPQSFRIVDEIDQKQIVKPLCKDALIDIKIIKIKTIIGKISRFKSHQITPEEALENAEDIGEEKIAIVYKKYNAELRKIGAIDFDDILIYARNVLRSNSEIREKWQNRFDYILVDEFQDTSQVQYDIIKILAAKSILTIVGDPDQNIYSWRGADISFINNFEKDFSGSKLIKLEENYRSTQRIIGIANTLIKNNFKRISKDLFTQNKLGELPIVKEMRTENGEARWIARKITSLLNSNVKASEIVVIYRANYLARYLESNFITFGLNYIVYGGLKFFLRLEIKDSVSYLRLLNNWDDIALQRIINTPTRKIGATTIDKLIDFAVYNNLTFSEVVIGSSEQYNLFSKHQQAGIDVLLNHINYYRNHLKTHSVAETFKAFLTAVGYLDYLKNNDEQSRVENVEELINSIGKWGKENPESKLSDYLDEISLYTENSTKEFDVKEAISLMTVHSAKGLEFEYVFMPSFNQGVFPSQRSLDTLGDSALEEERRLAYVAITRAKNNFFITMHSESFYGRNSKNRRPSQFVKEMKQVVDDNDYYIPPVSNYNDENDVHFDDGDFIRHDTFGLGEILRVEGELITVKFLQGFGTKMLRKNHKAIKKVS